MHHGVICAGQMSWDAAEEAHWRQDAISELHNDDTLWAFALRASEELHMLDHLSGLLPGTYCWVDTRGSGVREGVGGIGLGG